MRAIRGLLLVSLLVAGACGGKPLEPEDVFESLRVVVTLRDGAKLHDLLDTESRWAVATVWKYQREIADLVAKDFPPGPRERELERVAAARAAVHPRDLFAASPHVTPALASLPQSAEAMGRLSRVERRSETEVKVVTDKGVEVVLVRGPDGVWGYPGIRDALSLWRDTAANDRARIEQDAALYRRQAR